VAVADDNWKVVEQHRLTRLQFERWFQNRDVRLVIIEACGSAHHWARWLARLGIEARLLPAAYIRAYVKRNKTDAADACALLEASRCADIQPVRVKSVEQQALQGLHRIRSLWMTTRTSRINALRGFCREFGLAIPQGARTGVEAISRTLADPNSPMPMLVRASMKLLVEEIRLLEQRIADLEKELTALAKESTACKILLSVPGVGLLTATAMVAATSGDVTHFKDARHFASWFGLTPKEYSSGSTRKLGRISKRGDSSMACGSGSPRSRREAITTRRRVRWPTSWRASASPACATARSSTRRRPGRTRNSNARRSRSRREDRAMNTTYPLCRALRNGGSFARGPVDKSAPAVAVPIYRLRRD